MKSFDFEKALRRLEEITAELEKGDLSLDESLKLYEEGMKLKNQCYQYLQKAERKILKIVNTETNQTENVSEESIMQNRGLFDSV